MIELRQIDTSNFDAITRMKRPEGEGFVAPNAFSLAQAWLYRDANRVFPFAIYHEEEPVGFLLLDEDVAERCLVVWRIMFPPENQNKGYGSQTLRRVIADARASGKFDFLMLTVNPKNTLGRHVYENLGFVHTGKMAHGEMEMRLDL